jgi:hypothetical protein
MLNLNLLFKITGKIKKYEMREITKRELGLENVKSHYSE